MPSVKTASDCPTGIDTSQKTKKEERISVLKNVIYTELLKKYGFFPKPATQAWGSETQDDCIKKKKSKYRSKKMVSREAGSYNIGSKRV